MTHFFVSFWNAVLAVVVIANLSRSSQAFSIPSNHRHSSRSISSSPFNSRHNQCLVLYSDLSPSDVSDNDDDDVDPLGIAEDVTVLASSSSSSSGVGSETTDEKDLTKEQRESLKQDLLQLCASYDRGYGASPSARRRVDDLVSRLKALNPTPKDAARGIDGGSTTEVPLKGNWRMVWTTALDVLNLGANPIAAPGAIYQKIDPPLATNIIDFIPRIQTLIPSNLLPSSLLRAEVQTRTSSRANSSNRVGLVFESVKLEPVEVLGFAKPDFLPPLSIQFPQLDLSDLNLPGVDPENSPGFFDVVYLDEKMLIIQQNEPGGYFVSVKVPNCDP
ncbi:unnamed protein product [Cylindrotheca closterium]|uniref:Plastid lipid-associated protein/fibrillin conserved domain-containing protein n=1 Tax=Cylindrotheca closterium TaxID=2856 RepID=A0AAD2GB66_9STRA|nr:unnamed protein product [Cylindrotheca closterium]